jgi:pilus assembly protein TadC
MLSLKNFFRKRAVNPKPERKIDFFKQRFRQDQQKKQKAQIRKQRLKESITRAGFNINFERLKKLLFNTAVLINLGISSLLIYHFSVTLGITWSTVVASMIALWVLVFILLIIILWVIFYVAVDLRIFKRKVDIEEVLPDFLQLTASNINAGMPIDRALWFAVRPRFGVLAKEIEIVAKETMSGVDLKIALEKFASRYDSIVLKRTISMINEGIEAGGEIGNLLNRIAEDIMDQKSMIKEMSANVTTYVIFIGFATIVAAPFLFALSGVLIQVIGGLGESLGGSGNSVASTGLSISFSGTGVSQTDFKIFAIFSLMVTSFFSAIMTATIKKGNIKSGIRYIPIYMLISLFLYYMAQSVAGKFVGSFF